MFVKAWEAIGEFIDRSKAWLIEKLGALGPVWSWIKDWIIDPAAYGISKIRKGEVASDLDEFLRQGEKTAEEKKQEREKIRTETRKKAADARNNVPVKSVMELANDSARDHKNQNQPTIDAANSTSAATQDAADKSNKNNSATVQQQTTILTNNTSSNSSNSSSVVNQSNTSSFRAQNEILLYANMN